MLLLLLQFYFVLVCVTTHDYHSKLTVKAVNYTVIYSSIHFIWAVVFWIFEKNNNDDDVLSAPIGDDDDDDGGWMTGWLTVSLNGCFISCYSLTFLVLLQLRPKCFFSFGYLARNILNCLLLYIFFIYILKNFSLLHWSHESSARLLTRTQFGNCLLALLPLYHHKHRLVYR